VPDMTRKGSTFGRERRRGTAGTGSSTTIQVPPGVPAMEVVLAAVRKLQEEHGAVVEAVDVRAGDEGSITLNVLSRPDGPPHPAG
jgi:hypothetical protein